MEERLQKVLAAAGVASRRDAATLISSGKVSVNGKGVREPGIRINPPAADWDFECTLQPGPAE